MIQMAFFRTFIEPPSQEKTMVHISTKPFFILAVTGISIFLWHTIFGEKLWAKGPFSCRGLTSRHLSQPRRKGAAGRTVDLGRQKFWLWAKWKGGRGSGLFWGGGWNGFRTAGIARAHPYQCHGVDPRCRKWLNVQIGMVPQVASIVRQGGWGERGGSGRGFWHTQLP